MTFNQKDKGFEIGDGVNGPIHTTVVQPDGKYLIGGGFSSFNKNAYNRIIRMNSNGSIDSSFKVNQPYDGYVYSISLQKDGKFIVGGNFSRPSTTAMLNINRLNQDGSIDPSFNPGISFTSRFIHRTASVFSTAIQPDGKIIAGGEFGKYNGVSRTNLVRIQPDGQLDDSFKVGSCFTHSRDQSPFFSGSNIRNVLIQGDRKLIISGLFTHYNGVARGSVARLNTDGTLDLSFGSEIGANDIVYSAAMQKDGKIILVGNFTKFNSSSFNRIIRLNEDGTIDHTFTPEKGSDNEIESVLVLPDERIVIGGKFNTYNGIKTSHIAILSKNGSLQNTFSGLTETLPYSLANLTYLFSSVKTTAYLNNGRVLIGGLFNGINGHNYSRLAFLLPDGSIDTTFNKGSGINGAHFSYYDLNEYKRHEQSYVFKTIVLPDKKLLAVGNFTGYNGSARRSIVRINEDGSIDYSFNPEAGIEGYSTGHLEIGAHTVAVQVNGKILVAGGFTHTNGNPTSYLTRLNTDGSHDPSLSLPLGGGGYILTILPFPDGKILAGGFVMPKEAPFYSIAKLHADGKVDNTFKQIISGVIHTASLQEDGKIIIGGRFQVSQDAPFVKLARLNSDGTLDNSFSVVQYPDKSDTLVHEKTVYTAAIQLDKKIIIAGNFTNYNEVPLNHIARLHSDGTLDTSFKSGAGANKQIKAIELQPDGRILIGGEFTTFDGMPRNNVARLNTDGSLDTTFDPGTGAMNPRHSTIETISLQHDGNIIIGGSFTSFDGVGRNRLARIYGNRTLTSLEKDYTLTKGITYPNPFTSELTFPLPFGHPKEEVQAKITDTFGRTVFNYKVKLKIETNHLTITSLEKLPPGIYLLQISQGQLNNTYKVVKQ
ncbi:T9SS type A sorting domain-containing protein [Rufibacter immobilis]|uniref:T9SS type A sorting domain-containing protein n=1 Tax=Rufibacter immobilis TaxID=1348778 RepID=UPI00160AF4B2|nr:T9SS type A sorting domain-containing protein [Rufibacter immobilis]